MNRTRRQVVNAQHVPPVPAIAPPAPDLQLHGNAAAKGLPVKTWRPRMFGVPPKELDRRVLDVKSEGKAENRPRRPGTGRSNWNHELVAEHGEPVVDALEGFDLGFDLDAELAELDDLQAGLDDLLADLEVDHGPEMTHPSLSYAETGLPLYGEHGPAPENVRQGALGDCYMMATLMTMANHERGQEAIRNAITPQPDGRYEVALNEDPVTIDGTMPTLAGGGLAYAGSEATAPALWPGLIEKAFATEHGGYEGIHGSTRGAKGVFDDLLPADREAEYIPIAGIPEERRGGIRERLAASDMATLSTDSHVYAVMERSEELGLKLRDPNNAETDEEWTSWEKVFGGTYTTAVRDAPRVEPVEGGPVWNTPGGRR